MKNEKFKIIGLTGGIASGKTAVLNEFKKLGIKTISCDKITQQVYKWTNVQIRIKKLFRTLNRKKIAKIVFSDSVKRKQLEKILHPAIIKELNHLITQSLNHLIVVDVPLLFEAHLERMFNKIIVVYCKKNQQIERLMKRDKITRTEAVKRITSQMPLSKKIKSAEFVIKNTGHQKKIKSAVKKLLDKIKLRITNHECHHEFSRIKSVQLFVSCS
ncbi:MAG: dephospho-CoA kinase [Elusimicrobiota bacterium]